MIIFLGWLGKISRDQEKGSLKMAKSGVVEDGDGDPVAAQVMELKRELERIVKAIVVDDFDDVNLEALDRAHRLLCALKDLRIKRSLSLKLHDSAVTVPEEFRCPLSKELMRDPVIVSTGQVCISPIMFFSFRFLCLLEFLVSFSMGLSFVC